MHFKFNKLKSIVAGLTFILAITSCDRVKETAKISINKTGEKVGKGTSEFITGVSSGVDKTFQSQVELSQKLAEKGLHFGKYKLEAKDGKRNTLAIYLIFDENLKQTINAKVFDGKGLEYGRTSLLVSGKKGEARYFDFVFDDRTDLESRSKFTLE